MGCRNPLSRQLFIGVPPTWTRPRRSGTIRTGPILTGARRTVTLTGAKEARRVTIETEILIVGGGIAGASAAFHLADRGRRVVLLERGEIASGASGVNAGAIDSIGWGDQPDLQAHLTAGSVEIFKAVQLDLGENIEFRRSGALQAIHTPEQYEYVRAYVAAKRARGHQV